MGKKTILGNPIESMLLMLANNLPPLCPFPETLREAKFKSNGLINLSDEISKHS
jgi:hypothetical protein